MPGKSSGNRGRQHHHHHQHHQSRRRKPRKMESGMSGDPAGDAEGADAFADFDGETHQLLDMSASQPKTTVRATHQETENVWSISIQVFIPFLVAGLGMVGAGLVLDVVQHWQVFRVVSEVFILVPALLGLKGNLEMTLASRLSTQANLGLMDRPKEQWSLIVGNLALIQCQAIVVGFLASVAAMIMGWVPEGKFDVAHGLLLCASSLVTASVASFVLDGTGKSLDAITAGFSSTSKTVGLLVVALFRILGHYTIEALDVPNNLNFITLSCPVFLASLSIPSLLQLLQHGVNM